MPDRTLTVKLSARVEQYIAAMKAAEASTTGLSRSSIRAINQLGGSLQSIGRSMTRYVTVPIAALGAGAVYMAGNFEQAFAQMVGLANVPASEVDKLKESVLSLAGETARSPQELADALYLAASSGLDSAAAMDVVTIAAHGAAAGMGKTNEIVSLLTGAIGAYGAENLTAAGAADSLSAAIRDGKAEPEELAQTMGRILPISSLMGISFGEVAGALAFLTNTGLHTDQAVTGLRAGLINLYVPGKQARDMLETMGTSSAELKAAIDKNGLMGALELLREHGFADNTVALRKLIPEVRGFAAFAPLVADKTNTLNGIMADTTNAVGSLAFAFASASGTDAFKMQQAITDIKVAMIELGAVLLPIAGAAAKAIGDLALWFGSLPTPVLLAVSAIAGLAAAGGPLLIVVGSLLKNWQLLTTAFSASTLSIGSAAGAIGLLGIAVAAGFLIYEHFTQHQREVRARTDEVSGALVVSSGKALDYASSLATASTSVSGMTIAQNALSTALTSTGEDGAALTQAMGALGLQTSDAYEVLSSINNDGELGLYRVAESAGYATDEASLLAQAADAIGYNWPLAGGRASGALQQIADRFGTTLPRVQELVYANSDVVRSLQELKHQANGVTLNELAQNFLRTSAASSETGEKLVELAEALSGADRNSDNAAAAYGELLAIVERMPPAQEEAARTALGLAASTDVNADSANRNTAVVNSWLDAIFGAGDAVGMTTEQTYAYTDALFGTHQAAENAVMDADALVKSLDAMGIQIKSTADDILGLNKDLGTYVNSAKSAAGTADYLNKNLGVSANIFKLTGDALGSMLKQTGFAKAFGPLADSASGANVQLQELSSIADEAADRFNFLADRANDLRDAFKMITTPADDLRAATRAIFEEFDNMNAALDDTHNDFNDLGTDWNSATEDGRAMQEQTEKTRDAILEHAAAMMENGSSVQDASADVAYNVQQLNNQWRAAGLTEEQIAALNFQYGLTPAQVETALKTYGIDQANRIIDDYNKKLGTIPNNESTTVTAIANTGYAAQKIDALTYAKSVAITPYLTKSDLYVQVHTSSTPVYLKSAEGRFVPGGSNMVSSLGESGGTAGDEVVLPLGNPARMSALLGMSQVGPRVAAAMSGWMPQHGWSGGGGGGSVVNGGDTFVTVNMPPGSNGDDVVRALRKYQRRGGPVPISVR